MARTLEAVLFSTLGPLVANKVHPVVVPQGVVPPCICYATINATPDVSLCGSSGLVRTLLQVDIYAVDYASVRALREQVVEAMQDSFTLSNFLSGEREAYDPDLKAYRRILQFNVAEQEGA